MVPVRGYAQRRVAVLGLTGSGRAAARALMAGGADVTVWDEDAHARAAAQAAGFVVEDPTERDWGDLACLVVEQAGLVAEADPPRLIALARAVDAPVIAARPLLVEAAARAPGVNLALITGRHAAAAAETAAEVMDAGALRALDLECETPARAGDWVVAALCGAELALLSDIVEAEAFVALTPDRDAEPETLDRLADAARRALIVSAEHRACARLIATRRGSHTAAVSGRQVLGGGVYVAGGALFDALEGRARRAGALSPSTPREAVAAGYALARRLGVTGERAAAAIGAWAGPAGHGRCVLEVGPARLIDWSAARAGAPAADAVSRGGPVVWIAGPDLDRRDAALIAESGAELRAVHLITDRSRAARALGRAAPCTVHRDMTAALARGLHDALRPAGEPALVVYAPGSVSGQTGAVFDAACRKLVERALKGDAA